MTIKEMIKYLEDRGYTVEYPEIVTYDIEIAYNGDIGRSSHIHMEGPSNCSDDYLKSLLLNKNNNYLLKDLLTVKEVNPLNDDEDLWQVIFAFDDSDSEEVYYEISADDEDDAIDLALDASLDDFEILSYEVVEAPNYG